MLMHQLKKMRAPACLRTQEHHRRSCCKDQQRSLSTDFLHLSKWLSPELPVKGLSCDSVRAVAGQLIRNSSGSRES